MMAEATARAQGLRALGGSSPFSVFLLPSPAELETLRPTVPPIGDHPWDETRLALEEEPGSLRRRRKPHVGALATFQYTRTLDNAPDMPCGMLVSVTRT